MTDNVTGKHSVPFLRQLWLLLGVKLMEINSNLFSRYIAWCSWYIGLISHFVNRNHDRSHHTLEVPPLGGVLLQGIDPVVIGSAPIYRSHELRPFGRGPTTRSFGNLGDHYGHRIFSPSSFKDNSGSSKTCTWMSQEVSKRLLVGLQHQYTVPHL